MNKLLKKLTKYSLALVPLFGLPIVFLSFRNSVQIEQWPYQDKGSKLTTNDVRNRFANKILDLPCGFISKGKQPSEKPTFVTNNYIPILQYPAGNFPGTTTQVFSTIYSEHQNDVLELQVDGNLVLYCNSCTPRKALWSSQTNGKDGRALFFQGDGDLVLKNTQGKVIWHSGIHSSCSGSERAYFTIQDDGNMAMLYDDAASSITHYLGGTGTTNDQAKTSHPGKIQ